MLHIITKLVMPIIVADLRISYTRLAYIYNLTDRALYR